MSMPFQAYESGEYLSKNPTSVRPRTELDLVAEADADYLARMTAARAAE